MEGQVRGRGREGRAAGFKGSEQFTGPRSSPAVAEGKVCTLGVGGVVSCLDAATGKVVWRKDTKAGRSSSPSSSPIIVDGKCIAYVGRGGKGELTAFDLATGEEKWKWPGDGPRYGSPVLMTVDGVKQVVDADRPEPGRASALADGKLLWQTPFDGRGTTPAPRSSTATRSSARGHGRSLKVEKQGDDVRRQGGVEGRRPRTRYNTPVLKDGLLYGLTGTGAEHQLLLHGREDRRGALDRRRPAAASAGRSSTPARSCWP